jgi:DNA-directed RNA polymerase subunit RPC12/RpoP
MSIKFNCAYCQKRLKVDDTSAGKKAQCPKCQSFTRIPGTRIPKPKRSSKRAKKSLARKAFEDDTVDKILSGSPTRTPVASRKVDKSVAESIRPGVSVSKVETPSIPTVLPAVVPVAELNNESNAAVVSVPPKPQSAPRPNSNGHSNHPIPQAVPVQSQIAQAAPQSPYVSPQPIPDPQSQIYSTGGRGALMQVFTPLFRNAFYLRAAGWYLIIYSGVLAISIVGLVIFWLPLWLGICLRNAANEIDAGFATGDVRRFESASKNMSTYFVIIGVLSIVALIMTLIGVVISLLMFLAGGLAAFTSP